VYPTTTVEFRLSTIKHDAETETNLPFAGSPEILFCYEGSFSIENCSQIITLEKGQSVFIPFEVDGYSVQGKGLLFRARCNL
jgi:mannose-6-phosphate isomerase class I